MKSSLALLAVAVLMGSAWADAFNAPPVPSGHVADHAQILSPDTVAKLQAQLAEFERQTTTQVLVVTYPAVPDGMQMEDFTQRTAEAWGVGQKDTDNGAVLFVFPRQRMMRIEVGYGLEGALPDITARQIITNEITPAFRAGDYNAGVERGVEAIMRATRGEYTAPRAAAASQATRPTEPSGGTGFPILLFLAIVLFILISNLSHRGRVIRSGRRGPFDGPSGPFGGGSSGGGFGSGGFGGGGGGFSGGGGSFGGGGASGRW